MAEHGRESRPADVAARVEAAARAVRACTALRPRVAIVLGSGLGALTDELQGATLVPYAEIPHFPRSTAPGHSGTMALGRLAEQEVVLLSGRAHLYEGYSPDEAVFGVRVAHRLGAEMLIVTNAAGAVNLAFAPGLLMLISDHINLTGRNPLVGPNDPRLGVRFPDMSEAYSGALRALARRVATDLGLPLVEGVYLGLLGPSYETPAEVRMCRTLGADAVGMSTVLEVVAAIHLGMRVLGISCLTNMAAGILPRPLTEQEVIDTAGRVRAEFTALVRGVVARYGEVSNR